MVKGAGALGRGDQHDLAAGRANKTHQRVVHLTLQISIALWERGRLQKENGCEPHSVPFRLINSGAELRKSAGPLFGQHEAFYRGHFWGSKGHPPLI